MRSESEKYKFINNMMRTFEDNDEVAKNFFFQT